ncbi:reverse transcriptase family protein, partial [Patescibacteria group bacterium]|nr:reverse transcriptase family protein [Patescibacteria group bacterium]
MEELSKGIKKAFSAPGESAIPNEILKALNLETKKKILSLILWVQENNILPETWRRSKLVLLPKTSNPRPKPGEYRPIALLDTMYKIYTSMILGRLTKHLDNNEILSEAQCGGRKGRSTTTCLHTVIGLLEDAKQFGKNIRICSLDINKAFDSLEHGAIQDVLSYYKVEPKLRDNIMALYKNNESYITTNYGDSDNIKCTRGVRQGDTLSPILFSLCMNIVIEKIKKKYEGYKMAKNPEVHIAITAFVDDLCLIGEETTQVQKMLNTTSKYLKKIG